MSKRNILIVDDQKLFAEGLKSIIEQLRDVVVTGILPNGNNIEAVLFNHNTDVLILDLNLPGKTGIEILCDIRSKYPNLIIVILTMYSDETLAKLTKKKGANAYLSKDASLNELEHVIFNLRIHDFYLGQQIRIEKRIKTIKEDKFNKFALVTTREKEIIKLLAGGKSSIEVGKILHISPSTVHTHRKNIFNKLKINKISELIKHAYEHNIL